MSFRKVWTAALAVVGIMASGCGVSLSPTQRVSAGSQRNEARPYTAYTIYTVPRKALAFTFVVCKSSRFIADPRLQLLPLPPYDSGTSYVRVSSASPHIRGTVSNGCVVFRSLKTPTLNNPYIAYEGYDSAPVERFQLLVGSRSGAELVFFSDSAGDYPTLTLIDTKTGRSVPVKHAAWMYPAYSTFIVQPQTPYLLTWIAPPAGARASAVITFNW